MRTMIPFTNAIQSRARSRATGRTGTCTLASLIMLLLMPFAALADVEIEAAFKPATATAGSTVEYQFTIRNATGRVDGAIPSVDGLELRYVGPRQFTNIINGDVDRGVTHVAHAKADQPGVYTVPAFEIKIGGEPFTVPASTLKVTTAEQLYSVGEGEAIWLELIQPEGPLYVGQAIPLELNLYVRGDVRLENISMPQKEGDAFSMRPLTEESLTRSQVRSGTDIYRKFSWQTVAIPLKTAEQTISFKTNATIVIPSSGRQRAPFDNFFGDPFFNRMNGDRQEIPLPSQPLTADIQPLPKDNQPSSFSGGIGQFTMTAPSISDNVVRAGDVVMMTLEIDGSGNFERINAPELRDADGWSLVRTESETFEEGTGSLEGGKRFVYTLIPREAGLKKAPGLTFSYFDPEVAEYISFKAKAPEIEVIAGPGTSPAQPAPASPAVQGGKNQPASAPIAIKPEAEQPDPNTQTGTPAMLPNKLSSGNTVATLQPILRQPWFWGINCLPLAALCALAVYRRRQHHLRNDPEGLRRREATGKIAHFLKAAEAAAAKQDAPAFYSEAAKAIREAAVYKLRDGNHFNSAVNSLLQDLSNHANDAALLKDIEGLLQAAEDRRFAPESVTSANLKADAQRLESILNKLR